MAPLTFVHVSTQRGWHGGEEQARLLIHGLQDRGHPCVVVARADGKFIEQMAREEVEVVPFVGRGRGLAAMLGIRRYLRRLRPHVLHFHDPHALSGAGLAALGLPIPAKVVARRVDFPIRSTWRYRRLAHRVVAVSQAVADVCIASGLDRSLMRVVHDGVDPRRARAGERQRGRAALRLTDEDTLLLTVATLTDHKGHTFLLQALPAVLQSFPRVRLALAGDGELREALQAEARQLGIENSVMFLGFRPDVPDLLKAADLFVLPSHMEGFCSTLLDAMFARAPLITTSAGGIPEVVGGRPNDESPVARVVPPRDPAALAAAIIAALQDPASLEPLIDRAEQRALRQFTADHMVDSTLAVYQELLGEQASP